MKTVKDFNVSGGAVKLQHNNGASLQVHRTPITYRDAGRKGVIMLCQTYKELEKVHTGLIRQVGKFSVSPLVSDAFDWKPNSFKEDGGYIFSPMIPGESFIGMFSNPFLTTSTFYKKKNPHPIVIQGAVASIILRIPAVVSKEFVSRSNPLTHDMIANFFSYRVHTQKVAWSEEIACRSTIKIKEKLQPEKSRFQITRGVFGSAVSNVPVYSRMRDDIIAELYNRFKEIDNQGWRNEQKIEKIFNRQDNSSFAELYETSVMLSKSKILDAMTVEIRRKK